MRKFAGNSGWTSENRLVRASPRRSARDSAHYADLAVQRIIERVERAASTPTGGHRVHEYLERPLREVHQGNHRIIYRHTRREFEVITIVHFRQRLPENRME